MKRLIAILFCFSFSLTLLAQEHVFILVDVSGSRGNDPIKLEAKQQVYNLIMGQYSSNDWSSINIIDKKISELVSSISKQPLISQNSWICIAPFGNKDTYKGYKIIQNNNHPTDFQKLFNQNYPSKFNDGYTYISIAEAFTVSLAKTYNINEYYLFIITDGLGDQDDTNSKNNYDSFEDSLLLEWNNASSSIVKNIGSLAKRKYYINLRKVTNVKASQMPTNPGIQPPPVINTSDEAKIRITSNPDGGKNREIELKSDNLNVNWTCDNCPQGGTFSVIISEYDGGKYRKVKSDLISGFNIKVPDGKFKITVSAQNFTATSDTTYVSVNTGGFGWLLAILIILAAIGTGYYFWNKKRQAKVDVFASNKSDDIFSKGAGTTANSTNSDYF